MPVEYDPALPFGMIWRRDWKLEGNYTLRMHGSVRGLAPARGDRPDWIHFKKGWALFGLCFGSRHLFESWHGRAKPGDAAWMAIWRDDGHFGIYDHANEHPTPVKQNAFTRGPELLPGDKFEIEVVVEGESNTTCDVQATIRSRGREFTMHYSDVQRARFAKGYFGVVAWLTSRSAGC